MDSHLSCRLWLTHLPLIRFQSYLVPWDFVQTFKALGSESHLALIFLLCLTFLATSASPDNVDHLARVIINDTQTFINDGEYNGRCATGDKDTRRQHQRLVNLAGLIGRHSERLCMSALMVSVYLLNSPHRATLSFASPP